MKAIHVPLLLIFLFTSCSEEMTQAELTAKKIKDDIHARNATIQEILVSDNGTITFTGSTYIFKSDGFIFITTSGGNWRSFNLDELKGYSISFDSSQLYLYF